MEGAVNDLNDFWGEGWKQVVAAEQMGTGNGMPFAIAYVECHFKLTDRINIKVPT